MPPWLRILLVGLVVWAGLSLLFSLLRLAAVLGGLLALPLAIVAGYVVWKRGGIR